MYTAGFIGCGNMGSALAKAAAKKIGGENMLVSDFNADKATLLAATLSAKASTNEIIAAECKYIFLGVKPQMMASMLSGIKDILKNRTDRFILVSMAASLTAQAVSEMAGGEPVLRIMPNTPCSVGKGIILYAQSDQISADDISEFCSIMEFSGMLDEIPENLIDAASAISGCGPAFAYMFVSALADGGVFCGLPRDAALRYAAQMLSGSAEMILSSEKHPEQLKDEVCSPGGTTIAGVKALEDGAFRSSVSESVISAYEKTLKLKK